MRSIGQWRHMRRRGPASHAFCAPQWLVVACSAPCWAPPDPAALEGPEGPEGPTVPRPHRAVWPGGKQQQWVGFGYCVVCPDALQSAALCWH